MSTNSTYVGENQALAVSLFVGIYSIGIIVLMVHSLAHCVAIYCYTLQLYFWYDVGRDNVVVGVLYSYVAGEWSPSAL